MNNESMLYLNRRDVEAACTTLDSVAIMREVFRMHASGQTTLPDEAYLGWTNTAGEAVRSLNMPACLGASTNAAGTKIINGNIHNPARGLPRASGLTLLFDHLSARITCIMEGAYISSLRTASVSLLAAEVLDSQQCECVAVIGSGVQAQAHLELLLKRRASYPLLRQVVFFDVDQGRTEALRRALAPALSAQGLKLVLAATAEEAVRQSQLLITTTTTTTGYIPYAWLQAGALFLNVSLDDPLPDVVLRADKVVVDDWMLVMHDTRRLLGRMYREGKIAGPADQPTGLSSVRRVDAQLAEIVSGERGGRQRRNEIILFNPFGLAIEDIALASAVYQSAQELGLGVWLER
ncbi:MAG TPA: ornithine cyclodeaminase family protein [Ktedonobacteraceae bacterium]|jgi:ornithine cyclodeaminase